MKNENQDHLETLSEIKSLMERSSKFISLHGMAGVIAGIAALGGAAYGYSINFPDHVAHDTVTFTMIKQVVIAALLVLAISLTGAIYFTTQSTKKTGQKIWDTTSKKLVFSAAIPLVTGGLFCLVLLYHGLFVFVAPATLLFYGLALTSASKYTFDDIKYLGFFQLFLGLIGSVFIGYGLLLWGIGFGVLHIIYGTVMYFKYNNK